MGNPEDAPDGANRPRPGAGESGGGAYPDPRGGKGGKKAGKWHGGQSGTAYHGGGKGGDQDVEPGGNQNAGTES